MRGLKKLNNPSDFYLEVYAPPSKAHTLRAIFLSAISKGQSKIKFPLLADDQYAALDAIEKLGAKYKISDDKNEILIDGISTPTSDLTIDCNESGLTARIITAIACAIGFTGVITGSERMKTGRPINDLVDALKLLGMNIKYLEKENYLPLKIEKASETKNNTISISTTASSQFLTSLLIIAPLLDNGLIIKTTGKKRSMSYVDITLSMMNDFGVNDIQINEDEYIIENSEYKALEYTVEGDYSSCAFFGEAVAITGGKAIIHNLKRDSLQGDKYFFDIIEMMGTNIKWADNTLIVNSKTTKSLNSIDMKNCPDVVMSLSIVMAYTKGEHKITNISHLRIKESDRLHAIAENLKKIGAIVTEYDDSLKIVGQDSLLGNSVIEAFNDHRIAMSFAIAGLVSDNITIDNPNCVNKSFPHFWQIFSK